MKKNHLLPELTAPFAGIGNFVSSLKNSSARQRKMAIQKMVLLCLLFVGLPAMGAVTVGITSSGSGNDKTQMMNSLSGMGFTVVQTDNPASVDVFVTVSGVSSPTPSQPQITAGAKHVQIGDWGSSIISNTWAGITSGGAVTVTKGSVSHPLLSGLPNSWTSRGFHLYNSNGGYIGGGSDTNDPALMTVSFGGTTFPRGLTAKTLGSGRAVYVGWAPYGSLATSQDLQLLRNAIQWAATGSVGTETKPASNVTATSATMNGTANPEAVATNVFFEWGTNPDLSGASTTSTQSIGSGTSEVNFSQALTGLVADTTYYFRAVSTNTNGTQRGSILSFVTGPDIAVEQPVGTNLVDGSASISLGDSSIGVAAVAKTVTIKNTGNLELNGLAITKDGNHAADFTVSALGGTSLAAGASLTFTVTFTPSALGARSAAIHIASNDADENPFDITLSGTGVSYAPGYSWSGNATSVSNNNYYYDYSYGSEFTPSETIQLTHLGVYDHNQDGLSANMQVKLWNSSTQQELAATTVRSGTQDTLIGSSRYRELAAPVTLQAGVRYVVAAYYQATYNWGVTPEPFGTGTSITVDPRIIYNGSAYYSPTNYYYDYYYGYYYYNYYFSYPFYKNTNTSSSASYLGANFLLQSAAPANAAPTIARNNAAVTVNEGTQAANSGTFGDAQGNGTVTVTASLGSVTKNDAAGTWSWSHTPTDGHAGPTTVTITATDNGSPALNATATFTITVNNVAPSYDLGSAIEITSPNYSATVSFTDPGADVWTGTVDYGDGSGPGALSIDSVEKTFTLSHSYAQAGTYTVSTVLNDDDGGSLSDTVVVNVILAPAVTTIAASLVKNYSATLNGTVNPNNGSSSVIFEYGTSPTLAGETFTTSSVNIPAGLSVVPIAVPLTELMADTKYYYRIEARNDAGTTRGSILSFKTNYPASTAEFYTASQGLPSTGELYRPMPGVINQLGRISFKAFGRVGTGGITTVNDVMLYSDASGTMKVLGQESAAVPGGGSLSGMFSNLILSNNGRTVVSEGFLASPATRDYGYLISEAGDGLSVLSREGDSASSGGTFTGHTGKAVVDESEIIYFPGALIGVAATKNSGIWYDESGTVETFAKEGQNVTGITGDNAWLGNVSATLTAGGVGIGFTAALQNNPDNASVKTATAKNAAIFGGSVGALEVVARKGDEIPDLGKLSTFSAVSRNRNDDYAFISLLSISTVAPVVSATNDQVLMARVAGTTELVARENTTLLTDGIKPARFGHFYIANDGVVIFQAWGTGAGITTANDGFLCRWTVADGIEVLAREGSAAPGTGSSYGGFQAFSVSPSGAVVLQSTLTNVRITLQRALPGGALGHVIHTTQNVTFNGTSRSVLSLAIHTTGVGPGGGGNGHGAAINDEGAIFTVLSLGNSDYVARILKP